MTVRVHSGRKYDFRWTAQSRGRVGASSHPTGDVPAGDECRWRRPRLEAGSPAADWSRTADNCDLDPGWILGEVTAARPGSIPSSSSRTFHGGLRETSPGHVAEIFQRLWRHSVAVSIAARSLGREAGDLDCERLARAALLHGLGRWAVAAIDPEWIAGWLGETDPLRASSPGSLATRHRPVRPRPPAGRTVAMRPAGRGRGVAARPIVRDSESAPQPSRSDWL